MKNINVGSQISTIIFCIWCIPYLLYLALPFSLPINVELWVVILTLFMVFFSYVLPHLLIKNESWKDKIHINSNVKLILGATYIGLFCLFVDLYFLRGLGLFNGISRNRELYESTVPSVFGYISYLCIALSFLLIPKIARKNIVIIMTPIVIISILYLMSGNRQIFISYFIFIFLHYLFISSKKLTLGLVFKGGVGAFLFFVLMLIFQFSRQVDLEGRQLEFLYSISSMECVDSTICEEPYLVLPLAYLFQYYGNEYHGLTAIITSDISTPVLSKTVPVLYRRIYPLLGGIPHEEVSKEFLNEIESRTGMYPRFWMTKYSQLYTDFGALGLIIYTALLFVVVCLIKLLMIRNFKEVYYLVYLYISYSFIFGIMFLPTVEPVMFSLLCILILKMLISIYQGREH